MNLKKFLLIDALVLFGAFSLWVLLEYGYFGLWQAAFANIATTQVTIDLIICATLICVWMVRDARSQGRNALPYVVLTLTAGSFGPLLYLLLAPRQSATLSGSVT